MALSFFFERRCMAMNDNDVYTGADYDGDKVFIIPEVAK